MMGQCFEPQAINAIPIDGLPIQLQALAIQLNTCQQKVFTMVFSNLLLPSAENDGTGQQQQKQQLLMVHGEAGSGKTFLYNKICEGANILGIKIIMSAATGIAATAMKKASTVHSTFGLTVFPTKKAEKKGQSSKIPVKDFKEASLIIIDEISMLDVRVLQRVDEKFRAWVGIDLPFGGKCIILGGDRMQLVPPNGKKFSIYSAASTMQQFFHIELTQQMRQTDDGEFRQFLRQIGMGQIDWVQIQAENSLTSLEALIHFVYGPKLNVADGVFGLIISPTNRAVNLANSVALAMLDGEEECFEAVDTLAPGMDKFLPPEEDLTKIAAKTLKLKRGAIVMLLKNLCIDLGLANGTRLIYEGKNGNILLFKEFNLPHRSRFIARSAMMIPLKTDGEKAAYLRRLQFPVRLAFATTIHKCQSQTVDKLGLFLSEKCRLFAEGMAYTALSRLRTMQGLRVFSEAAAKNADDMQVQLRNICSPYAQAAISMQGGWVPAPDEDANEQQEQHE